MKLPKILSLNCNHAKMAAFKIDWSNWVVCYCSKHNYDCFSGLKIAVLLHSFKCPCAVFWCNNDYLFSSLVLEIWTFTVYFSGKGWSLLHQNMAQGSFCPLQSYSKKTLRKNVPKSVRKCKRNVLMPPGHPIILFKSN